MADLRDLKPAERDIEITHPADPNLKIGIRVKLISLDDDRALKSRRRIANKRIHLNERGKTFSAEDLEKNARQIVFGCMVDWDWSESEFDFNGENPDFNEKNVIDVFTELPWFFKQVQDELNEEKDFFQK